MADKEIEDVQEICKRLGESLRDQVPKGMVFSLLMAETGYSGELAYVSDAGRLNMIELFRFAADKLEGDIQ